MKLHSCMNLRNIQIVQALTLATWYFRKSKAHASWNQRWY